MPFSTKATVASTANNIESIVVETDHHMRVVRMKPQGTLPVAMVARTDWKMMERCLCDALISFDGGK